MISLHKRGLYKASTVGKTNSVGKCFFCFGNVLCWRLSFISITDATERNIPKIGPNKYFINVFIFVAVRIELPYVYTNNDKNNELCRLSIRFVLIILTIICIVVTLLPKLFIRPQSAVFRTLVKLYFFFFFETLFVGIYYVQPSEPNLTKYPTIN